MGSRLKFIFHWSVLWLIFLQSISNWIYFLTTEYEISSANNFLFGNKLSENSLISIENNEGSRIEPEEATASRLAHGEYWALRQPCVFHCLKNLSKFLNIISYAVLLQFIKKNQMPRLVESFGYRKKYRSYFTVIIIVIWRLHMQ